MYRIVWWAIDLIDAPVVSLAEIKALGWSIAVGILGYAADAVIDIIEVLTKVDFVPIDRRGKFTRRPAKHHISRHICRFIIRLRVRGLAWKEVVSEHIINGVAEHYFTFGGKVPRSPRSTRRSVGFLGAGEKHHTFIRRNLTGAVVELDSRLPFSDPGQGGACLFG
ncbi:hypothetical protein ES703_92616 [subsurface metagenome]